MVHLPDTMVDLSDTMALPDTMVHFPDTMVDLLGKPSEEKKRINYGFLP